MHPHFITWLEIMVATTAEISLHHTWSRTVQLISKRYGMKQICKCKKKWHVHQLIQGRKNSLVILALMQPYSKAPDFFFFFWKGTKAPDFIITEAYRLQQWFKGATKQQCKHQAFSRQRSVQAPILTQQTSKCSTEHELIDWICETNHPPKQFQTILLLHKKGRMH